MKSKTMEAKIRQSILESQPKPPHTPMPPDVYIYHRPNLPPIPLCPPCARSRRAQGQSLHVQDTNGLTCTDCGATP